MLFNNKVIYINSLDELLNIPTSIFAIGNFDGCHLGHKHILYKAKNYALLKNSKAGVITFEPHPLKAIENKKQYFLSLGDSKFLDILNCGIDIIVVINFHLIKDMSFKDFFYNILLNKLKISSLFSGINFTFGKSKSGDVNDLQNLCISNSVDYMPIELLKNEENEIYSSSNIRKYLSVGNIKKANDMLGRYFMVNGVVIKGNQLARKLGFPTANVNIDDFALLKKGVYVVNIILDNVYYKGVANFGVKPTIGDNFTNILEIHIFNFDKDIYNNNIFIEFVDFLREEIKFNNINDLLKQIKLDVKQAYDILCI